MTYTVTILRRAQKELSALSQDVYVRIRKSIWKLADEPRPSGSRKLAGRSGWRIRPKANLGTAPIALRWGPRAGQKVLSLQTVPTQAVQPTPQRCVNEHGFSLHAEMCCTADQRKKLEHLCRYITRPAIANERLTLNRAGQVVLRLKTPYRDGTTHIVMSPLEFMQLLTQSSDDRSKTGMAHAVFTTSREISVSDTRNCIRVPGA